jgi:hypothetical protein
MEHIEEEYEYTSYGKKQHYDNPEMGYQIITSHYQVSCYQTREHYYGAIQKQYAPIWQCLS